MKSTVRLEEIQYVNGFGLQEYSKLASKYGERFIISTK